MALIVNETFTADGTFDFDWRSYRKESDNIGTITAVGAFGGGTLDVTVSFDGGTNFVNLKNSQDTAISFATTSDYDNFPLNAGNNPISSEQVIIRLTLSGATSPNLNVRVLDIT